MTVIDGMSARYRGHFGYDRWTLCIGAGASVGVVPSWLELARQVVNEAFSTAFTQTEFRTLVFEIGWGLDSWIQAAANKQRESGRSLASFQDSIERALYGELLAAAARDGVEKELRQALNRPRAVSKRGIEKLRTFFDARYGNTTLVAMVKWLMAAEKRSKLPFAVLSFNAEPLLHSVFEIFASDAHYRGPPPHSHPSHVFTRLLKPGVAPRDADEGGRKVPIYHCHGALIPDTTGTRSARGEPSDLIFLEEEYLKVNSRAATFPETIFMFHAQQSRLLFVGMSMSDPNIRRWLSLLHSYEAASGLGVAKSKRHVWLTKRPADAGSKQIQTVALAHMGVRTAWIDDWADIGPALQNLTGV